MVTDFARRRTGIRHTNFRGYVAQSNGCRGGGRKHSVEVQLGIFGQTTCRDLILAIIPVAYGGFHQTGHRGSLEIEMQGLVTIDFFVVRDGNRIGTRVQGRDQRGVLLAAGAGPGIDIFAAPLAHSQTDLAVVPSIIGGGGHQRIYFQGTGRRWASYVKTGIGGTGREFQVRYFHIISSSRQIHPTGRNGFGVIDTIVEPFEGILVGSSVGYQGHIAVGLDHGHVQDGFSYNKKGQGQLAVFDLVGHGDGIGIACGQATDARLGRSVVRPIIGITPASRQIHHGRSGGAGPASRFRGLYAEGNTGIGIGNADGHRYPAFHQLHDHIIGPLGEIGLGLSRILIQ